VHFLLLIKSNLVLLTGIIVRLVHTETISQLFKLTKNCPYAPICLPKICIFAFALKLTILFAHCRVRLMGFLTSQIQTPRGPWPRGVRFHGILDITEPGSARSWRRRVRLHGFLDTTGSGLTAILTAQSLTPRGLWHRRARLHGILGTACLRQNLIKRKPIWWWKRCWTFLKLLILIYMNF
jgi:hypothetical protein